MEWDISDAVKALRSIVGDGATDKFVFRQDCSPVADNVTTRFFTGDTRLVPGTLDVSVSGVALEDLSEERDEGKGCFTLPVAPSGNVAVQASYYYQWFSDPQLVDFLTTAVNLVGYETVDVDALTVGLRPVVLHWAAANAFVAKAAEFADSLSASAPGGYSMDRKAASPNWLALAKFEGDLGNQLLQTYINNPLTVKIPAMAFVTYALPVYVPRT